jgi:chromosome segregation ATPase
MDNVKLMDEMRKRMRDEPANAPAPEPSSRSSRVEAGLVALEEAEREREALRGALAQAETDLRGVRAELDMVNLAHSRAMGELDRYRHDRDEAVTRLAAVEAVYDAVLTIMQKHRGAIPEDSAAIQREGVKNAL